MILTSFKLWLIVLLVVYVSAELQTLHEWKYIDFVWESDAQKQQYLDSGNYSAKACAIFDVDIGLDGRVFITIIRDKGVPASLFTLTPQRGDGGLLLRPYPDWSWYSTFECSQIISVYRVAIDQCGRMFVLDTGMVGDKRVCPAQILIFNLSEDKLVQRVVIPDEYATNSTTGKGLLVTPIVNTDCASTWVYMADPDGQAIVVWNGKEDFWRINGPFFSPNPLAVNYTIAGKSFTLADGVLGMALSPSPSSELYFRPLASFSMYSVPVQELQFDLIRGTQNVGFNDLGPIMPFKVQSAAMAVSQRRNVLFFSQLNETALLCWNRQNKNNEDVTVVAKNENILQFPSGMKVIGRQGKNEKLFIVTNRYQIIGAGSSFNLEEVNFRILHASVLKLIENTPCYWI